MQKIIGGLCSRSKQSGFIHVCFERFFLKITLDKTKGMVYNEREHKILLFLNPYGD